jgi:hypothetical protein
MKVDERIDTRRLSTDLKVFLAGCWEDTEQNKVEMREEFFQDADLMSVFDAAQALRNALVVLHNKQGDRYLDPYVQETP